MHQSFPTTFFAVEIWKTTAATAHFKTNLGFATNSNHPLPTLLDKGQLIPGQSQELAANDTSFDFYSAFVFRCACICQDASTMKDNNVMLSLKLEV